MVVFLPACTLGAVGPSASEDGQGIMELSLSRNQPFHLLRLRRWPFLCLLASFILILECLATARPPSRRAQPLLSLSLSLSLCPTPLSLSP